MFSQPFAGVHTPFSGLPGTPGTGNMHIFLSFLNLNALSLGVSFLFCFIVSNLFSPAGQQRKTTLSPAQVDPFFTQGDTLSSEDALDDTWVTVFGCVASV